MAGLAMAMMDAKAAQAQDAPFIYPPFLTEQEQDVVNPFSYFLRQSDELGFAGTPKGVQITYDGAYNTQFGEFTLAAGTPLRPLNSRIRTLAKGFLPVINYAMVCDGIEYQVQSFASPAHLDPLDNLILFIRVAAHNSGRETHRAAVGGRFFNRVGEWAQDLFAGRKPWWWVDKFTNREKWHPSKGWEDLDTKDLDLKAGSQVYRSGHLLFTYAPDSTNWSIIETENNSDPVEFSQNLRPGQTASVVFKIPFAPVEETRSDRVKDVIEADYDQYLQATTDFWNQKLDGATVFSVPEEKVVKMEKASLMYDLVARNLEEDRKTYVQTVNLIHYNAFFSRDAAFIIHVYDLLGRPELAEQCIDYVLLKDNTGTLTGFRMTHPDAWGQVLWTVAAHYRITGDRQFAERVYPAVPGHIEKLRAEMAKDPLGLWPVAGPYDNEMINGHYTGHSFWVLLGLRGAVQLAEALGKQDDATKYQALHDDYLANFNKQLAIITKSTGGYIPPGLDHPTDGMDWENATGGVYPFGVLSPSDPLVSETVKTVRNFSYQEGITTYGDNALKVKLMMATNGADWSKPRKALLHHYELFNVLEPMLALGMDREAITDFYSFLLHTGSTQSGFEYDLWAWRDRFPHDNYPPHGWCAARFNEFLRNLLVREDTEKPLLHLASALSPLWLPKGKEIRVENAPTDFGVISYKINSRSAGAEIAMQSNWRQAPSELVFHVPWFLKVTSAKADGKTIEVKDRLIHLPAATRHLSLAWKWTEHPDLSYETGVKLYLDKYWKLQKGIGMPGFDSRWIFPEGDTRQ